MASEHKPSKGRPPMDSATRNRLQQWFQHGTRSSSKGEFDYATESFERCVDADPGNMIYAQALLANLHRKYNNNKKGSTFAGLRGTTAKASIKKAELQKDWPGVIRSGIEMLKLNPWDVSALCSMAAACEHLEFDECQLLYLRSAVESNPKDVEVNRQFGRALARLGKFDEAIAVWSRVAQAKPGDPEAQRAIADLTINKTIHKGGYEEAKTTTDVMADRTAQAERTGAVIQRTPEQQLERAIAKDPSDLANYRSLAELHLRSERFDEAEAVFQRALEVSPGDLMLQEALEDVQLRRAHQHLAVAERKAREEKTEQAQELYKKMKAELNRRELEVYAHRVERYPANPALRYELALRLKRAGNYPEAIKAFQDARGDSKHKAHVYLELGECFHKINQFKLAMSNYEQAIAEVADRDPELRKLALYRAGVLASGLKDLEKAENYLTELAGLDFGYKDVSERLDKLAHSRDKG
jgi:tetratricopeptide (TPR) repeat protein